jgi:hypothetical protein
MDAVPRPITTRRQKNEGQRSILFHHYFIDFNKTKQQHTSNPPSKGGRMLDWVNLLNWLSPEDLHTSTMMGLLAFALPIKYIKLCTLICIPIPSLAGNVADMLPTCRPDTAMSANFSRKGMLQRHTTRKKRPRHTVFVCRFANTDPHMQAAALALLQHFAACICQIGCG